MNKSSRVLVVDDFEMMRFVLTKALKEMGVTNVEEAEHGKQAIDKLADADIAGAPYELVFCDWNMPEATGMEVLQFCRVMPSYQKIPFVMVTAEAESQNVIQAIKSGATDYIVKPVTPEDLAKKLDKIFAKFKLQAA
jgi:two-component system, chemotaxis family, chemotaxis protein CheY